MEVLQIIFAASAWGVRRHRQAGCAQDGRLPGSLCLHRAAEKRAVRAPLGRWGCLRTGLQLACEDKMGLLAFCANAAALSQGNGSPGPSARLRAAS